jgi:hypothetical protein
MVSGLIAWLLLAIFCVQSRNQFCLAPYFSWENIVGTIWDRQKKQVERLFFCIGNIELTQVWSCLACYMMSFPYSILFNNNKKNGEKFQEFFSFLGMSDIACVFNWYLNSLCINLLCLDMIKSLWLYLPSVFLFMQKLDSFFLHAMKMYTIQDSPKGTSFLLWLFASRNYR